ncbi:HAMP domain-containing histidine kinase [Candidatus Gracilibacteria bacterium]|nr:HAMP domain-containing histidine kinase [Candidatus Gracilibacteria bacterium]
MEKKELKKTKKRLTIVFTIMVFSIATILGFSYFLYKYISEKENDLSSFKMFVNSVLNYEIEKDDILSKPNIPKNWKEYDKNENRSGKSEKKGKFDRNINYILFDVQKNVVSSDLRFDVSEELFEKISKMKDETKYYFFGNYIVKSAGDFMFIKEMHYNFSTFLRDILGFLFLNFLSSAVFYFIGFSFVNRVFKPVEENISDMKNFIHNAGHELKTPISVIDSNIQLLLDMKTYDEEMILELKTEVLKLNSLLQSLINLSDIGSFRNVEKVDLSDIIEEILKSYSEKIQEKNIKIEKNIKKNIFVIANRDYLYIFLSNIIGNAIKYNKVDGEINISFENSWLTINDNGIGISDEDLPKIFDRFFKSDKSRNTPGFGIGLSLVQKIAEVYDWKMKVGSELGKGTKFLIKFGKK